MLSLRAKTLIRESLTNWNVFGYYMSEIDLSVEYYGINLFTSKFCW